MITKGKSNQKLYAILIIIIAVAAAYFFILPRGIKPAKNIQPKTVRPTVSSNQAIVDTSGWETYRSEKFGYEIKYPKGTKVDNSHSERSLSIIIKNDFKISNLDWERQQLLGYGIGLDGGLGLHIFINDPADFRPLEYSIDYSTPCEWLYSVNKGIRNIIKYDLDTCTKGATTFNGESAYIYEHESNGIEKGLYAMRDYVVVFFHNGSTWEIGFNMPPKNPTDIWKNHPYYKYLEQSVPISQAIIDSFRFTDAPHTP